MKVKELFYLIPLIISILLNWGYSRKIDKVNQEVMNARFEHYDDSIRLIQYYQIMERGFYDPETKSWYRETKCPDSLDQNLLN